MSSSILGKSMSGKKWEDTVNHAQTSKHCTSLVHHSLPSSDGLYTKNFDNPDCSNVYNFGTSDMHGSYNPTLPGTSFQGIISSRLPSSPTSTLEEHGLQKNSNIDHIYDQSSSVPGNGYNSPLCDLGPLLSDGDIENWLPFGNCDRTCPREPWFGISC
ncbi:unnamed protein product [Ilex paraguariensis]|uniref:Uncharacterized protein n=1 Tax=Ilex paraguariensis TaxID=185542 RepID=A0ABC8U6E2_9AQUA